VAWTSLVSGLATKKQYNAWQIANLTIQKQSKHLLLFVNSMELPCLNLINRVRAPD